jgi:GDP-L-fucose synthase
MKIYIAGHKGLVGSALMRVAQSSKNYGLITKNRSDLELTDSNQVFNFFEKEKPDWVFLAAARVGGIYANNPENYLMYLELISWVGKRKLLSESAWKKPIKTF